MPEIEEVDTGGEVPEEELPEPGSDADLERFFRKVKCTKEEALEAKHLQWGWKEMGKEDGAALAFVIRNNPVCITLDLFVNEIYEEAGALVGRALKDNTKLKTLDLQQAQIGVEGGRAIAEASGATRTPRPLPEAGTHPLSSTLAGASHEQHADEPQALLQLPRPGGHQGDRRGAPRSAAMCTRRAQRRRHPACALPTPSAAPPYAAPAPPRAQARPGSALPLRGHSEPMHAPSRASTPCIHCACAARAGRSRRPGATPSATALEHAPRSPPLATPTQVNKRLTNLDLGDNGVARQGCEALAAMLGKNTTLARLGPPPPRRGPPSTT